MTRRDHSGIVPGATCPQRVLGARRGNPKSAQLSLFKSGVTFRAVVDIPILHDVGFFVTDDG